MESKKELSNASSLSKKKKLEVEATKTFILNGMREIRGLNCTDGVKNQKEKRLGKSAIVKLSGRSSRSDKNKAKLTYFNREVTAIRKVILLEGFVHHAFYSTIEKAIKKYPIAKKELNSLLGKSHIELKNGLYIEVIKKLSNRLSRTKNKENKTSLRLVISLLKNTSFRPVFFETFVRTSDQLEEMTNKRNERIERYHTKQRVLEYKKVYKIMNECLSSEGEWESLAFGLALACGRRSIEILSDSVGTFKSTSKKKEALFTTTAKTKEAKEFLVPLLIDYDVFNSALNRLRSAPRIANLMEKVKDIDNTDIKYREINRSVQEQLGWAAKEIMEGRKLKKYPRKEKSPWTFKDARAIYAKTAYVEYVAECGKKKTPIVDDNFYKKHLGHSDLASQQSYKQFTITGIEGFSKSDVKEVKREAVKAALQVRDRYKELSELFSSKEVAERKAFVKYAEWVLEQVKLNPSFKITGSAIKGKPKKDSKGNIIKLNGKSVMEHGVGGNKGVILEFVSIIKAVGLDRPL